MPEPQRSSKYKPTPLHWVGFGLLVFGSTLTANFIVREFRESTPLMHKGDKVYINGQYAGIVGQDEIRDDEHARDYGLIAGSVLIAVVGVAVMVMARRRSLVDASTIT